MIDYRNTLNLPYTKFAMRANLSVVEVSILEDWNENNLYEMIRRNKNKKKIFLLHDGPPYANGNIHLGHAVNKVLKDIILKFKGLSGYNTPYIPGWDCHGLPVELKVKKIIKDNYDNIGPKEFRNICRKYVIKQVEMQKKDFIRLGVLGDWKRCYLTMDFKIEANIIRTLSKIISNGYFYKGVKPVYWCFECCSTLANSEVEYQEDHCSCSVDVGFSVIDNFKINKIFGTCLYNKEIIELVIWTTTLWSLPVNQAIAVHPNYIYQLVRINYNNNNKYIIIAEKLVIDFMVRIQCTNWEILGESVGYNLEYLQVQHPFMLIIVPIILSKHIKLDSGTGIVHIAPNHGIDDYIVFQNYKFKVNMNMIDDKGYYLFNVHSALNGLHIFQSSSVIISLLCQSGNFLYINNDYRHSYPYCWRHMTPLIFRSTSQWFLNMHHNDLKNKLLQISKEVDWIPKSGLSNIKTMILNRPDWCISRQRVWGVPIPILIHKEKNTLHPNTYSLMEKVAKLVEKYGIQVWWDLKIEDLLLNKEEAILYKKEYDTLDVWFDSGSTHDSVILERFKDKKNFYPIDLYLEGSDQYRGWFMSSLIISVAINNRAPYKKVLSHGFTVDYQGNKMSKSSGNSIQPQDIINKFGADILRLWIASSDYSKDMTISDDILSHIIDIYRRIRNTIRFCLSNLNDFNPSEHLVLPEKMIALDRWIIDHALSVQIKIIEYYDKYQFHNVVKYIMKFCSIEMGSFYLDIIKDRQYTLKKNSLSRRSCQTALYHIVESMVRWIAPILSFTSSEAWKYIPGKRSKYIFTEEWYNGLFKIDENQMINSDYWNIFFNIRNEVNKIIEQSRANGIIKGSLESNIIVYAEPKLAKKLRIIGNELAFGLLVSLVIIVDSDEFNDIEKKVKEDIFKFKIVLKKSKGVKCLRCWNYVVDINRFNNYKDICFRCIQNITGSGEDRKFF